MGFDGPSGLAFAPRHPKQTMFEMRIHETSPIGSMYAIYAIYGNMDPINIRPLCYIPAPWIRHGSWNIMKPPGCQLRRRRRGSESTSGHEDFWGVTLGNYPKMSLVQMSSELYLSIIYPDSCAFSSFHVFLNILSLDGLWIFMARPQVAQIYRMYKDLCQHLESGSSGKGAVKGKAKSSSMLDMVRGSDHGTQREGEFSSSWVCV